MRAWSIVFFIVTFACVSVAACGGSSGGSGFDGTPDASTGDASTDGGNGCVPKTCAEIGAHCGLQGDGCGNIINCGGCAAPTSCGGGSNPNECGGNSGCKPRTCANANADCGPVADGCGGALQCGTCTAPATCGGGGAPSKCGGSAGCVPKTCAQLGIKCGPAGDGCGNLLQCGSCPLPETCGGGGLHSVCGQPVQGGDAGPDGGPPCNPITCAQLGISCGPAGDGCGGQLNCGSCNAPQSCGGGGQPGVCGGNAICVPKTCQQLNINCGPAGDGCGGQLNCGSCQSPQICGGGGTPSVCGGSNGCTPKTCAQLGFNCGVNGDGCGGTVNCGTCQSPQFCGGGGPSVCGVGVGDGGVVFSQCDGGIVTQVSGRVVAGTDPTRGFGNPDPIYNALVFIAGSAVQPFPSNGVTCDTCASTVSGSPIVSTVTGADGTFTLLNVPVGAQNFVIQLGKWRRQVPITITQCKNNVLGDVRMPRNKNEGDIPLMAIATGNADPIECVLRKMGIEDSEFTTSGGSGRVRIYQDNGGSISGNASASTLVGSESELSKYDIVLLPCVGNEVDKTAAQQKNVVDYANKGGRVFTTHYSYVWFLKNNAAYANPWFPTAPWNADPNIAYPPPDPLTANVDQSFQKGKDFARWLLDTGASTTLGQLTLHQTRHDVDSPPAAGTERYLYASVSNEPGHNATLQHFAFNTPWQQQSQCGRVVFSNFHVNTSTQSGAFEPGASYCKDSNGNELPLTAQERALEFMLFDIASCVTPPTCTPKTCSQLGYNCGVVGDGCGGTQDCGTCQSPQVCGGGGPNVCGGPKCTPKTCGDQGINCGPAGDGCGNLVQCGVCPNGQSCGGGGQPGVCGKPNCTPKTCTDQNIQCGPAGDGCGNLLQCGACAPPAYCGGGGPGACGIFDAGKCQPITCADQNLSCGPAGDGCGGQLDCGTCTPPQTCGGGGTPGQCGAPNCTPRTCKDQNINCGPAGDGCGKQIDCGSCTAPQTCGGGGVPGQCGGGGGPR